MALDRPLRNKEPSRNLGIRQMLAQRYQYLKLSAGDATLRQPIRHQPP